MFDKIRQWAQERNLIAGATSIQQYAKCQSEMGELADALLKRDHVAMADGIGDVVVVLTIIAAQEGLTIEECIEHAYNEIEGRRGIMFNGSFIKVNDPRYATIMANMGKAI